MAGLTAIKRKGFKGGGMDASTSSFDKGATSKGPNPSREDRVSHGATQFQSDNQGFTATGPGRYTGGDDPTPTKKERDEQKFNYNKQFYNVGQIGPSHSRKSFIQKHNLKKRLAYREMLMRDILKKQTGANVDNVLGIEAYGPEGTGKYSQTFIDDVLSGKRLPPDYFTKIDVANVPGGFLGKGLAIGANIVGPYMSGPVTKEKLNQLLSQQTNLENFDPEKTTIKQMMETYQPNRFEMLYGDNQGGDGPQPYLPIDYNTGAATVEAVKPYTNDFVYRFGDEQNVGANVLRGYAANGGRISKAGGGIMNAVPRQGYFLGKIVKGVGKAIGSVADAAGKVLKSDVGKMALLYGATAGLGSLAGGGGFSSLFKAGTYNPANFLGKQGYLATLGKKALLKDGMNFGDKGALSLSKILGISAALPFIPGINKAPENEDIGMADRGGRLLDSKGNEVLPAGIRAEIDEAYESGDPEQIEAIEKYYAFLPPTEQYLPYSNYGSQGYRTTVATGGRIRAEEGGLMNLGGMEKDYRAEGGFVPIGKQEKADDVPARLSVNEFVFTADAVRNAGGGDIDKGAEVMENMMKNLENGGTVSEESQGNTGAQNMFSVSERIGEVI